MKLRKPPHGPALLALFTVNGFSLGSWISRIPATRDILHLDPGHMGLVLLAPGVGAVVGLPIAGRLAARLGPAREILIGTSGAAAALGVVAAGLSMTAPPAAAFGLFGYGLAISHWDVGMNVSGTFLEHRERRPRLPMLHAGLSLGSVAGAGAGAGAAAAGVPVVAQLLAGAVLILIVAFAALPSVPSGADRRPGRAGARLSRAWREPRTVLIGITVLAFALLEGTAGNWLALALVDGHHASEVVGALGYDLFVAALTAGRAVGAGLITRAGRVATLRCLAAIAAVGVLLVSSVHMLPVVLVGCALWGFGTSLGFPVGMSAAGDDPECASARVSVVSTIGYAAFFSGPPLVGFLADRSGILTALAVAVAFAGIGLLTSPATRPLGAGRLDVPTVAGGSAREGSASARVGTHSAGGPAPGRAPGRRAGRSRTT